VVLLKSFLLKSDINIIPANISKKENMINNILKKFTHFLLLPHFLIRNNIQIEYKIIVRYQNDEISSTSNKVLSQLLFWKANLSTNKSVIKTTPQKI